MVGSNYSSQLTSASALTSNSPSPFMALKMCNNCANVFILCVTMARAFHLCWLDNWSSIQPVTQPVACFSILSCYHSGATNFSAEATKHGLESTAE